MNGAQRPRMSASFTYDHSTPLAVAVSLWSCSSSAANDLTTRTPLMFSSTMVATSASRDWINHDTGNIDLRILTPTTTTAGIVAIATRANGTLMDNMNPKATTATPHCTRIDGPNVMYICTERMSELAREINCPDWT